MQLQSYLGATDYMIPELDPNFLDGTLGIDEDSLRDIGESMAERNFVSSSDLVAALKPFSDADRQVIIASFVDLGGNPDMASLAIKRLRVEDSAPISGRNRKLQIAWAVLGTASMAASAFHGYRRNQSIGWALVWGILGGTFPVLVPTVALAQGFGQPK